MRKKILGKILLILMISLILFANMSFATRGWDDKMNPNGNGIENDITSIENFGNKIIGIMQVIGVAGGVITLILLGVKYMTLAPSERADIKKTAGIYVAGAVMMFAATGILQIIRTFAITIE